MMNTEDEQLRQEIQDAVIQACSFEYDEGLFAAIDDVHAIVERERREAVEETMERLHQSGFFLAEPTRVHLLAEMFPPRP